MEIYNASEEQVWLADYFLSDNMGSPGKYRFPERYLQAGDFYLVWLDDQEEQGENHATFKISKEGEKLRLSRAAFHRVPCGGFSHLWPCRKRMFPWDAWWMGDLEWVTFTSPTPRYSNLSTGTDDFPAPAETLILYPNPVSEGVFYFNKRVSGAIYNIMGQKMMDLVETEQVPVTLLEEGLYIFRSEEGDSVRFIVSR